MLKKIILSFVLAFLLISSNKSFSLDLNYYLTNVDEYNQKIATPEAILGFQVGGWHATPSQIERYFQYLSDNSPRVKVEITGYTHEKKPLMLVYISSAENIKNLEQIRKRHLTGDKSDSTPNITWMGYSVHGNEASGSNASLLFGYHFASANDEKTKQQLSQQVIILEPMLNPDGLARFAHWVNMYRSKSPNADPKTMEHNEVWPQGRTNHYWFDLNRDWLLLQHPESQARVRQFHRWRPHVLTDFHEMGTNSSYFFQPGVPSRQNPLTDEDNYKMTATIAKFHAKSLDDIGSLYYSKENFDDFYYGKGSTYPDAHGSVGILFEQASSRGHVQENIFGEVSFPFAIKNHLTTSFSTIEAVQNNTKQLKLMREKFIKQTESLIYKDQHKAVVFDSNDPFRINELLKILDGHQIKYFNLARSILVDRQQFNPKTAYIIPFDQPQYRLIKSLFESRKKFKDNVFYDVSAWNIAMAFDINFGLLSSPQFNKRLLISNKKLKLSKDITNTKAVALAFNWQNFQVAQLLSEMQQQEFNVQGVTKPSKVKTVKGVHELALGSIVLPLRNQSVDQKTILDWLAPRLKELNIEAIEITSGLAISGVDMGSPSFPVLDAINPLLIIGDGISPYDAGEVWHLLDQRLSQPLTMLTQAQFKKLDQINYSHLILVSGDYNFDEQTTDKIETWISNGGVLIAHSKGAEWLLSQNWSSSKVKTFDKNTNTKETYANKSQIEAKHIIGGAIVTGHIDITHPLGFGLDNSSLAIFKRGQQIFTEPEEAFVGVARLTNKPHAAGYISERNIHHIANGTSILIQSLGQGRLIAFSDNPLFRGVWLGTSRVFVNALYYGQSIKAPEKSKQELDEKKL